MYLTRFDYNFFVLLKGMFSFPALFFFLNVVGLKSNSQTLAYPHQDFGKNFEEKLKTPEYNLGSNVPFTPVFGSLESHTPVPEWFRNAKFGIYAHWGVYSVPAFGSEWYPRNMYNKESKEYKHQIETYGPIDRFSYPDFVPLFTANEFDADEWAKLFREAGAKFAGPVAEHHDGFSMWKTTWTPWNSFDMGPRRDISRELERAIRKQGLKFMASFHHGFNNLYFGSEKNKDHGFYGYILQYFPELLRNEERAIMYGYLPKETFNKMWVGKLKEYINQYHPDFMWFDFDIDKIPDSIKNQYLAFYFNSSSLTGQEVLVSSKDHDFPDAVGIQDFERGRLDSLVDTPWLTDDAIGDESWCYVDGLHLKSTSYLIHELIDIVSKNGQLLLNISPMANGIIPDDQKERLLGMGKWLKLNGEAIYDTRPWLTFGEGPTRLKKSGSFVDKVEYTYQDIRYTKKGNVVYAIILGWPGNETEIKLRSWKRNQIPENLMIKDITMIGSKEKIEWRMAEDGLVIETPSTSSNHIANTFKISTTTN